MTFTRRNLYIGTVLVKPDKNFYRPFIEGLAGFCQSQKAFGGQIEKVMSYFNTSLIIPTIYMCIPIFLSGSLNFCDISVQSQKFQTRSSR